MNPLRVSRSRGFRCSRLNEIARQIAEEDGTPGLARLFPVKHEPLPGEMPWWRKPRAFRERCQAWCRENGCQYIDSNAESLVLTYSRDGTLLARKMEAE